MDYTSAEKERIIRFYYWALRDFEREIQEDYRLVRTVPQTNTNDFLRLVERLTQDKLVCLSRAMVKNNHPAALALTGKEISYDEQQQLNHYRSELSSLYNQHHLHLVDDPGELPPKLRAREVSERMLANPGLKSFSEQKRRGPNFVASMCSWRVQTSFSYNSKIRSVEYWHSTCRQDGKNLSVPEFGNGLETHMTTDLLRWLGIGRTIWLIKSQKDIDQAAGSLSQIMLHYLTSIRSIISDLE